MLRRTIITAAWLAALGTACFEPVPGGSDGSTQPEACDPLQSREVPIELGRVLAVGRARDERLFVVDHDARTVERLFVSVGDSLLRMMIAGSGSQHEASVDRIGLLVAGDEPYRVLVEIRASGTRMMVVSGVGAHDRNLDIALANGEELKIVDSSIVETLAVAGLETVAKLEYFARVESAFRIIVVRPRQDWSVEDFRVFYGPPDRMEERQLIDAERYRDGGSTIVRFHVGAAEATAFFPNRLQPDGSIVMGPVTFEVDGKPLQIERLVPESIDLGRLAFVCQ